MHDKLDGLLATTKIAAEVEARAIPRTRPHSRRRPPASVPVRRRRATSSTRPPTTSPRCCRRGLRAQGGGERKSREKAEAEERAAALAESARQRQSPPRTGRTCPPKRSRRRPLRVGARWTGAAHLKSQPDGCSGPVSAGPDEPAGVTTHRRTRHPQPRHDLRSPGRHGEGGFSGHALHVKPARWEGAALHRDAVPLICPAAISHVGAMAYLYSAAEEQLNRTRRSTWWSRPPAARAMSAHTRQTGAPRRPAGDETEVGSASTLEGAGTRGRLRARFGACRVARQCSEDEPEFRRDLLTDHQTAAALAEPWPFRSRCSSLAWSLLTRAPRCMQLGRTRRRAPADRPPEPALRSRSTTAAR